MINFQNKHGFTIMEVLLALIISCVVMVASVPIITVQKNYGHIEKWNRTQNGADIFYGSPKDNMKVGIGTTTPRVRLHIRGYEDEPLRPVMTIRAGRSSGVHSVNFVFADNEQHELGRLGATTTNGDSIAIGAGAANNMGVDGQNPTRSVAIGVNAMRNMRNSENNVVIGGQSYRNAIRSNGNVIIGGFIGNGTAYDHPGLRRNYIISDHRTGNLGENSFRNILIGEEAGASKNMGTDNICIGAYACTRGGGTHTGNVIIGNYLGAASLSTNGTNRIVIGSYASANIQGNYATGTGQTPCTPGADGCTNDNGKPVDAIVDRITSTARGIIVGGVIDVNGANTTIKYADVEANNVYTSGGSLSEYKLSDKRYKNIVGEYKKSLDDLEKISVYRYKYKSDGPNGLESSGVIAQEIESIFPDAVMTRRKGKNDIYMVNYDYINMATLNSVKELQKKNKELKQRVERLKKIVSESKSCSCK